MSNMSATEDAANRQGIVRDVRIVWRVVTL